jgi:hypothetical protein
MRVVTMMLVVLAIAGPAAAKKGGGIAPSTLTLVQAQCDTTPPSPCAAAFAFKSGVAVLTSAKQPAPTCPKTGAPTESKGGQVTLKGVTKSGAAFSGSLSVEVVLRTSFGVDPTGDCPLAGIPPITIGSLTGTAACNNGTCKGTLYPIACLDPPCADTPVISEFVSLTVFDDAGNKLAVPGTVLVPVR